MKPELQLALLYKQQFESNRRFVMDLIAKGRLSPSQAEGLPEFMTHIQLIKTTAKSSATVAQKNCATVAHNED